MNRAIRNGATVLFGATSIAALAFAWQARSALQELELGARARADAHARLARKLERLELELSAREGAPPPAVTSGLATRSPEAASERPRNEDGDGRRGERDARESSAELLARFPTLAGEAKARAIDDLVRLARADDAAARDLIVASLRDADAEVREEAADAIEDLADPALFDALAPLANDPSDQVREEVVETLATMPAERAGPVLAGMLGDPSRDVAEEAIEAIGRLGYRGALPQLVDLVRRGDDLELVAEAGSALRGLGETNAASEAVSRIATSLASKDAVDRLAAVRQLRNVGGDEAIAHLREVLENDSSQSVRAEAREALDRLLRD